MGRGLHSLVSDVLLEVVRDKQRGLLLRHQAAEDVPDEWVGDPHGDGGGVNVVPDVVLADAFEAERLENAARTRRVLEWLGAGWFRELWLLRQSLQPQIVLMHHALRSTSEQYEVKQWQKVVTGEARDYRATSWVIGDSVRGMLTESVLGQRDEKWRLLHATDRAGKKPHFAIEHESTCCGVSASLSL